MLLFTQETVQPTLIYKERKTMSSTPIFITPQLRETLIHNNIDPTTYGPAYSGESACLDLYYAPAYYDSELADSIFIGSNNKDYRAGQSKLIPTGLHIALPKDRVALVLERGSITKTQLKARAGVIDAGYTGEIFINCVCLDGIHQILPRTKLPFQLLITTTFNQFQQLTPEEWEAYTVSSGRKDGSVGSSDTKR